MTKYHRLGGSKNGHLLSHSSGDWKAKNKGLAGLVSGEGCLLAMASYGLSSVPS